MDRKRILYIILRRRVPNYGSIGTLSPLHIIHMMSHHFSVRISAHCIHFIFGILRAIIIVQQQQPLRNYPLPVFNNLSCSMSNLSCSMSGASAACALPSAGWTCSELEGGGRGRAASVQGSGGIFFLFSLAVGTVV